MIKWLEQYLDFFAYPVLLLALLWFDSSRIMHHPLMWLTMFLTGWLVWTFAEYWVHRSLLHGPYWMGIHERHHQQPRELTRFPLWQIPTYFLAIFVAVWLVSRGWTVAVYSGIILGWIMFFGTHHLLHHWPHLAPSFAIRHNRHHKLTDMNYGITVDWWDRLFGTFRQ